jgi:hypothetical protein
MRLLFQMAESVCDLVHPAADILVEEARCKNATKTPNENARGLLPGAV